MGWACAAHEQQFLKLTGDVYMPDEFPVLGHGCSDISSICVQIHMTCAQDPSRYLCVHTNQRNQTSGIWVQVPSVKPSK